MTDDNDACPAFPDSDRGLRDHWRSVAPKLEAIARAERRSQGTRPNDWRIVDSLLQLGYLHRQPQPTSGLIQWQRRLAEARVQGRSA